MSSEGQGSGDSKVSAENSSESSDKAGELAASKNPRGSLLKFRGAALSVLSKVIEAGEDDEDGDEDVDPANARRGTRSRSLFDEPQDESVPGADDVILPAITTRRRSTLADIGAAAKIIQQNVRRRGSRSEADDGPRRPSFMAVVGLMNFRNKSISKQGSKVKSEPTKPKLDLSEIKPEEMPNVPRFSATLSEEAQYATLLGYGDKLANYLKKAHHPDWRRAAERTRTPSNKDDLLMGSADDGDAVSLPQIEAKGGRRSKKEVVVSTASSNTLKLKQLKVTHRLEYAMDILDKVKVAHGEVTTTPRTRVKSIDDPLMFGESWLESWDKEFTTPRAK